MAWHSWKACFKAIPWVMGGVALAIGCSHAWDDLEPSGSAGSAATGHGGHPSSGDGDDASSSSTGAGSSTLTVIASVAACVNVAIKDPGACEIATGKGEMNVDQNGTSDMPDLSFVRFDIDGTLVGKTIDTVTLQLTVASDLTAGSDHSGEVWEVSPFTLSSLSMTLPTKLHPVPACADQGSVDPSEVIKWPLPASILTLNSGLFLGILPTSTNNAAYWNTAGNSPPKLIITYH